MFRDSQEEGVNRTLPLGAFCPQFETHACSSWELAHQLLQHVCIDGRRAVCGGPFC